MLLLLHLCLQNILEILSSEHEGQRPQIQVRVVLWVVVHVASVTTCA
jgi:hypothetical protein